MDDHVYFIDQMSDEKILALLKAHQTFFLKGANDENKYRVIEIIEKTLGELGMRHKVYTGFPTSFMRCAVSNFEFIVATRLWGSNTNGEKTYAKEFQPDLTV
jgi:hypothetical protein